MTLGPNSELETVALVLTKEQARRLRAIVAVRKTAHRRTSLSEVGREIVELGLAEISRAPLTGFTSTSEIASSATKKVA